MGLANNNNVNRIAFQKIAFNYPSADNKEVILFEMRIKRMNVIPMSLIHNFYDQHMFTSLSPTPQNIAKVADTNINCDQG